MREPLPLVWRLLAACVAWAACSTALSLRNRDGAGVDDGTRIATPLERQDNPWLHNSAFVAAPAASLHESDDGSSSSETCDEQQCLSEMIQCLQHGSTCECYPQLLRCLVDCPFATTAQYIKQCIVAGQATLSRASLPAHLSRRITVTHS
jgi:hypothetical protein